MPSIPNNTSLILILLGFICIFYGYKLDEEGKIESNKMYSNLSNNLFELKFKSKLFENQVNNDSEKISQLRNQIKNSEIEKKILKEEIDSLIDKIEDRIDILYVDSLKTDFLIKNYNQSNNQYLLELNYALTSKIFGLIFIFLGIFGLMKIEKLNNVKLNRELNLIPISYKYCQSCGKNFNSIIINGKNKDETINIAFCNNCFDDGKFKKEDLTVDDILNEIILDNNIKDNKVKLKTRKQLSSLDRWTKTKYF